MPIPAHQRQNPVKLKKVQQRYAVQLRKIAKHVGDLIEGFPAGDPSAVPSLTALLQAYSDALGQWAMRTGTQMLAAVNKQDEAAWRSYSYEMSRHLTHEIRAAPTGQLLQQMLAEQVSLIQSIPLDAAKRVHELTLTALEDSTRAADIAKEIRRSGEVAASRATLIARTEVARTASKLTQARAESVGSDGYIWRTAGDSDVRESHRQMNGKFVRWDSPPTLSDGTTTHAGAIYNCRCYPEPVIPDED